MSKFFQENLITASSLPQISQNKRQKVMTQKTVDRHFISCMAEMFSLSSLEKTYLRDDVQTALSDRQETELNGK